jgi:hypothetical protein
MDVNQPDIRPVPSRESKKMAWEDKADVLSIAQGEFINSNDVDPVLAIKMQIVNNV